MVIATKGEGDNELYDYVEIDRNSEDGDSNTTNHSQPKLIINVC